MARVYVVDRIAVDTSSWTAITPPIDCNKIILQNADAQSFKIRSDSADSDTELPAVPSGAQQVIAASPFHGQATFSSGTAVCYVQASSGTGPIVAEFVR